MSVYGQNPHKVVDEYSAQFERDFLELLSMRRVATWHLHALGTRERKNDDARI